MQDEKDRLIADSRKQQNLNYAARLYILLVRTAFGMLWCSGGIMYEWQAKLLLLRKIMGVTGNSAIHVLHLRGRFVVNQILSQRSRLFFKVVEGFFRRPSTYLRTFPRINRTVSSASLWSFRVSFLSVLEFIYAFWSGEAVVQWWKWFPKYSVMCTILFCWPFSAHNKCFMNKWSQMASY